MPSTRGILLHGDYKPVSWQKHNMQQQLFVPSNENTAAGVTDNQRCGSHSASSSSSSCNNYYNWL